jgi:methylmalonyl-CoA mutase
MNENPLQGAFVIDDFTDRVEEAVLAEFYRLSKRGSVMEAMEIEYQRGGIQDESMLYKHRKHDGTLPIIGVNTFLRESTVEGQEIELVRATNAEKRSQLDRIADFLARHAGKDPEALRRLQDVATGKCNVFNELMRAARVCSLGQLTDASFEVGEQYQRSM